MPPLPAPAITTTSARHRGLPVSLLGDARTGWIVVAALDTPFELPLGTIPAGADPGGLKDAAADLVASRTRAEASPARPAAATCVADATIGWSTSGAVEGHR